MSAEKQMEVSVIIPVYNRADLLPVAIQSCLDQAVEVEVLVIDDGSMEDIDGVLQKNFPNDLGLRIRHFRQENQGACVARNLGLSNAAGEFVKFLDSDDELLPDALAQEVGCLRKQDADVVVTAWKESRFDSDGTPVAGSERRVPAPDLKRGIDDMLLGNGPWTSAALYRREFIKELCWDPAWAKAQDWGWALTVCLAGAKFVSLDFPSAFYKHHEGARITSGGDALLRSSLARQNMLKMTEEKLSDQNGLTNERKKLLAEYYYRDRIVLCQHSPKMWKECWMHCRELVPEFIPGETSFLIRTFVRGFGAYAGIRAYVFLKKCMTGSGRRTC
jgi:glycosyltransferase involved in cell wall biosynthesis